MTGHGYEEAFNLDPITGVSSFTDNQNWVAGYTTNNVAILAPISVGGKDYFQALSDIPYRKGYDECLVAIEPASATTFNGAVQTHAPGVINYKTMSPCMVIPPSTIPDFCTGTTGAPTECDENPWLWMARTTSSGWPTKDNYGGILGLARDGHVIVGPYNEAGELWACDEHDFCNGTFLADGSYAYVMTTTFPYVVGCWGPGTIQYKRIEKCS